MNGRPPAEHDQMAKKIAQLANATPQPNEWIAAYMAVREAGGSHAEAVSVADEVVPPNDAD